MDVRDYLQKLMAFDTSSSSNPSEHHSNEPMLDYIRDLLLARHYVVAKFKVSEGNFNLLALSPALLHSSCQKRYDLGILLSGHSDCVPFQKEQWHSDPLELTEKHNRYYGRGAADMKGFLACMLHLSETIAARFDETCAASTPDFSAFPAFSFLFTADEECSMCGAQAMAALCKRAGKGKGSSSLDLGEWQADAAVKAALNEESEEKLRTMGLALLQGKKRFRMIQIGEPTMMQPVIAHKGWMARELDIFGWGGHSSNHPRSYINAIELSSIAIAELSSLREEFEEKYYHPDFTVPFTTLNFGMIHGGKSINSICDHVKLSFDVRPTPNLQLKRVNTYLDKIMETLHIRAGLSYTDQIKFLSSRNAEEHGDVFTGVDSKYLFQCFKLSTPFPDTPAFSSADKGLRNMLRAILGQDVRFQYANYCTEASYLQDIAPCVVLGPGDIIHAHQDDEFIESEQLQKCEHYLEQLLDFISAKAKA